MIDFQLYKVESNFSRKMCPINRCNLLNNGEPPLYLSGCGGYGAWLAEAGLAESLIIAQSSQTAYTSLKLVRISISHIFRSVEEGMAAWTRRILCLDDRLEQSQRVVLSAQSTITAIFLISGLIFMRKRFYEALIENVSKFATKYMQRARPSMGRAKDWMPISLRFR